MRIISTNAQRDYYDSLQSSGVDRSIVYLRETKVIRQAHKKRLNFLSEAVIGFCGKTYPIIYYIEYQDSGSKKVVHPFYDLENLKAFIIENPEFTQGYASRHLLEYFTSKSEWSVWKKFREHFDKYSRAANDLSGVFVEHKVPIFLYQKYQDKLTLNPILSAWEFYRIVDSWTAFQEISMYLGNVLVTAGKDIPEISDETKASLQGFDKYSFRKDKQK